MRQLVGDRAILDVSKRSDVERAAKYDVGDQTT